MEHFWYIVLVLMFTMYILLDGYDLGAGIIYLFLPAEKENDKKLIVRSIGPFWDANEVWLIAAGGILFFAFPTLYASAFSGFYLPLMIILWLLIFRATGLELRAHVDNLLWKTIWDKAFGISSLLLALFFGIALGNIVRGVNLGMVENGISQQEAHYFFLPLWNETFSPQALHLGIIDWFTLLFGVISVFSLSIHGACWIIFKTNAPINKRLKQFIFNMNLGLIVIVGLSLVIGYYIQPAPFHGFFEKPLSWIFVLVMFAGLGGLLKIKSYKKDGMGFLFSSAFLAGGFLYTVTSIFPAFLPSTNGINPSLTINNVAADQYGLGVGIPWFVVAMILVIIYLVVQYRIFRGKMDQVNYHDDH